MASNHSSSIVFVIRIFFKTKLGNEGLPTNMIDPKVYEIWSFITYVGCGSKTREVIKMKLMYSPTFRAKHYDSYEATGRN